MAWDVLSRVTKTAWDGMSEVTKTAWDVLSGVANLCGMFCPGWQKWHGMFCPGMFCPAPTWIHHCTVFTPYQSPAHGCKAALCTQNPRHITYIQGLATL